MFDGYLALGSTEIINSARTHAYVRKNLPRFPLRAIPAGDLALALGDDEYESPLVDDAPWVDVLNPATHGFYGLYPLSIEGIDNSTRTAPILELVNDGGVVGAARHASRQIRVRGLLLAADELALDAGNTWLRAALSPAPCANGDCGEGQLYYFAAPPEITQQFDRSRATSDLIEMAGITAANSPLIYLIPETAEKRQVWGTWQDFVGDGAVVRWGALGPSGSAPLEQYGPVVPHRRNHLLNPSFTTGTATWQPEGRARMEWMQTGGVDGGPFVRLRSITPSVLRTNWLANPSLEHATPLETAWTSNGTLDRVATPAPPHGEWAAVATPVPGEPLWVEVPILGPVDAAPGYVSFAVAAHSQPLTVTVLNPARELVASLVLTIEQLAQPWQRRGFEATSGVGYTLRFSTAGAEPLLLDSLMVGAAGDYFDGDTTDAGDIYAWSLTPENSPSTWTSRATDEVVTNLVPNPRAASSTGATVATAHGIWPRAIGFVPEADSVGWQSPRRVLQGQTALAIDWTLTPPPAASPLPYPATFYPGLLYPGGA